jgi:tetratricopeptide (TPR) repeat protein
MKFETLTQKMQIRTTIYLGSSVNQQILFDPLKSVYEWAVVLIQFFSIFILKVTKIGRMKNSMKDREQSLILTTQLWEGLTAQFLRLPMPSFKYNVTRVFAIAALSSCSHVVVIKSDPPGARVRMINDNGKAGPSLGVTPLDLNSLPNSDVVVVEIDKENHLPKQVVVPKVTGSRLTINAKLQPLSKEYLAERGRLDFAASLNANLFEIFKLQSLILEKNSEEVLKMETRMREQWEGISLYQSLLGNFYYITGDFKKAKARYEKALSLDPRNEEARNMLSNLR